MGLIAVKAIGDKANLNCFGRCVFQEDPYLVKSSLNG